MTNNVLELTDQELKQILADRKKQRNQLWSDKANGVECHMFDGWVLYYAENEKQVKDVLTSFETFKDMGEIDGSPKKYTTAPTRYRIDIHNNFYDRKLQIAFGLLDMEVKVQLDFNNMLPETGQLFSRGLRSLYDTERHYVNGSSKEFKNYRVRSYGFGGRNTVSWYGGNETLLDTEYINVIINHFINA
jgi:hypothetical protein